MFSSNALMLFLGGYEWILVILVIVIVIFGAKKIPEIARSFGKAKAEFEKGRIQSKNELDKIKSEDSLNREKLESIADTLRIDYIGKDDESLKMDIDAALKRGKEYDSWPKLLIIKDSIVLCIEIIRLINFYFGPDNFRNHYS